MYKQLEKTSEKRFFDAVKYGDINTVNQYIKEKGHVDAKDNVGGTALRLVTTTI
jgi:hypothetical protein